MPKVLASNNTDDDAEELNTNAKVSAKIQAKENEIKAKGGEIEELETELILIKNHRELLKRELTDLRQELKREEKKLENAEKKKAKEAAKNDKKNIVKAEPEANLENLEKENVSVQEIQHGASTKKIVVVSSSQVFCYYNGDGAEAEKSI